MADDLVVGELQRGDARLLPDFVQVRVEQFLSSALDLAQPVELRIITGVDHLALDEGPLGLLVDALGYFPHDGKQLFERTLGDVGREQLLVMCGVLLHQ